MRTAVFFVDHLWRCARTGPPLQMPSPSPASVRRRRRLQLDGNRTSGTMSRLRDQRHAPARQKTPTQKA